MIKNLTILTLLLLGSLLFVANQLPVRAAALRQSATATPMAEEDPVATPVAAEEAANEDIEEDVAAGAHDHADADATTTTLTIEELAARVATLEEQLAGHHADEQTSAGDANAVTTALYLLDNVDLHEIDVRINETGTIAAGDAGTVARINRVLSTVAWPTDLADNATTLMDLLTQLNVALTDDNLAEAGPLATQAHEAQHELSHTAEHWLGTAMAASAAHDATAGQANRVTTAVYLLDAVGLHDLDVRLNEDGTIDPSDAGNVARIQRLLGTVDWPETLSANASTLIDILAQLNTTLADDNVTNAAPLATQAHEAQHELSHAAEHWLATMMADHADQSPTHDEDAMSADDAAGHDQAAEGEETESEGEGHSHD